MKNSDKRKNNLQLKIISLIMAIFMWSFVTHNENPIIERKHKNVAVEMENLDILNDNGNYVITKPVSPKVNVDLRGGIKDVNQVNEENIKARMDLGSYSEGKFRVKVDVSLTKNAGLVDIMNVEPLYMDVVIEKVVDKALELQVETTDSIPEGYVLGAPELMNKTVNITGPRSKVEAASKAVIRVNVDNIKESEVISNNEILILDKDNNPVSDLELSIATVDVQIAILKTKTVPIELVFTGSLLENQNIENESIEPNMVTIKGTEELIESITKIKTRPIDYERLIGTENYETRLDLPEGVSLFNPDLKFVLSYNIVNNISKTFSIDASKLEIRNSNEQFNYEINREFDIIEIQLSGDQDKLEDLDIESIGIYIDVDELGEGDYEVGLKLTNVADFKVKKIEPNNINISIKEK